jgi:hypothetical protein
MFTGHISGKLYEQTGITQADVKRVEYFCIVDLLGGDIALT